MSRLLDLDDLRRATPVETYSGYRGRQRTRYTQCLLCGEPLPAPSGAGRPRSTCGDSICAARYNVLWHRTKAARAGRAWTVDRTRREP